MVNRMLKKRRVVHTCMHCLATQAPVGMGEGEVVHFFPAQSDVSRTELCCRRGESRYSGQTILACPAVSPPSHAQSTPRRGPPPQRPPAAPRSAPPTLPPADQLRLTLPHGPPDYPPLPSP